MSVRSSNKPLPLLCPSCSSGLLVQRLSCTDCGTVVEGLYVLPALARIPKDDQAFLVEFVKASGSLKQMASLLGVSYPTVRNRLDDIIQRLKQAETDTEKKDG